MPSGHSFNPPRQGGAYRAVLAVSKLLVSFIHHGAAQARPVLSVLFAEPEEPKTAEDPGLWIYLAIAIFLVLLGGAFAGLTIALMGQDEIYLQVIADSGEGSEKKNAIKVLKLLNKGKHWVLVTLLVGNVITNETLPIVLDRSIGGGYAAAIASTVLVIIFGEIVPQSVCVRFGLPIGAWTAPFVLTLMWVFAPITYPIAKLLDRLLGEDHGTTYKKAGLKTLVTLHQNIGQAPSERLNQDEVTIISGVLDLKTKSVDDIMTPMTDVFTLSADAILDEEMMENIMREGYSRIPIHEPKNPTDFVGMLLVKMLLTYDPEDARKVSEFSLATLPETRPDTSCLDIINFFQKGKSHMVLVSDDPGEPYGALGVVTLEDVIEELIGEEIVDESDVFVDIHKAIRRIPAPFHAYLGRARENSVAESENLDIGDIETVNAGDIQIRRPANMIRSATASADPLHGRSPRGTKIMVRRKSSLSGETKLVHIQQNTAEMREPFRTLAPASSARHPQPSRVATIKIKPGVGTIPENSKLEASKEDTNATVRRPIETPEPTEAQYGIGQDLVSPGLDARDGVAAVQAGYGTLSASQSLTSPSRSRTESAGGNSKANREGHSQRPRRGSHSTIESLPSPEGSPTRTSNPYFSRSSKKTTARSGSITENLIDTGGVKKLVLELTSSSEEADGLLAPPSRGTPNGSRNISRAGSHRSNVVAEEEQDEETGSGANKSRRRHHRRKKKKKKGPEHGSKDENAPLLRE